MKYFVKFGETFLKSNATKKKFVSKLIDNFKKKWIENIKFFNAYLLVETDKKDVLLNTFWVHKLEEIKYTIKIENEINDEKSIIDLFKDTIENIVKNYDFSSFRISAKRENKQFPINSMDLQMILWKYIWTNFNKKASYKDFELDINIRILKDEIWVWTNKDSYFWIGGLPYGIEWKSLNLFSGWIDSPVATFLAAKRWIKQHFLFLNIPWSEILENQVYEIYSFLNEKYGISWRFFSLDFSPYIKHIKQNIPSWFRQIIFKKLLYKISDLFAYRLRLKSVVNGENLWQVSTQTLVNMELLDKENNILNIRPLVCFDKIEIIELAKKIWTYNFSEKIKETCSLESHSDARIKNVKKIDDLFDSLNFDLEEIVNNIEEIKEKTDISEIKQIATKEIVWQPIYIEKLDKIPTLEKWKQYTFICSSGYKASKQAYKYKKQWYDVYYLF